MFKWLKGLTNKSVANVRKHRKRKADSVLDGIKADLDAVKNAQAQATGVSAQVEYHSVCVKKNSAAIEELQKQVAAINETVLKLSATLENASKTSPLTSPTLSPTFDTEDFTHLQECALIVLLKLTIQEKGQWISMKALVNNLYPGQDYNKVRTTIFEYVRIFEELGLISRIKRGNRTFIALTKKGTETAKKRLTGKKEKLLYLPEIEV